MGRPTSRDPKWLNQATRSHSHSSKADHQVVTVLTAEAMPPAGHAGHCRTTWVGNLIIVHECHRGVLAHFFSSMSTPAFASASLSTAHHPVHYRSLPSFPPITIRANESHPCLLLKV
jgi:hypothetical protein